MGCQKQHREGAMQQWAVLIKKQGIAENNYYVKHSLKMEEQVTQKEFYSPLQLRRNGQVGNKRGGGFQNIN